MAESIKSPAIRKATTRSGQAVDAISQSIMVVAEIEAPGKNILPGMSGTATFSHDDKIVRDTQ